MDATTKAATQQTLRRNQGAVHAVQGLAPVAPAASASGRHPGRSRQADCLCQRDASRALPPRPGLQDDMGRPGLPYHGEEAEGFAIIIIFLSLLQGVSHKVQAMLLA